MQYQDMLVFQVVEKMHHLSFGQLMRVYYESNLQIANKKYVHLDDGRALLEAEQDQYAYLQEFFKTPGAFLAVWAQDSTYQAALRMEPYADGILLEGLETAPDSRRRGYAKELICRASEYAFSKGIHRVYAHVDKKNAVSIKVHEACGFVKLYDHAVFIDGSVDHRTVTYIKRNADD